MALGNVAFFRAASRWAPRGSAREYTRGRYRIPLLPESGLGGLRRREFRRPNHAVPRTEGRCPSGARGDVRSTTSYFHRHRHSCCRINPDQPHWLAPSVRKRTPQPLERPEAEIPEPEPAQLHLRTIDRHSNRCRDCRANPSEQAETVSIKDATEHDRLEQIVRQCHPTNRRKADRKSTRLNSSHLGI